MLSPKEYIESIKNRQLSSDKEFILDSLTGAIDRLEKAFPRYGSFLMEFVQNADDANSKYLKIEILENAIKILNNGDPFTQDNVKSICKVGRSSKTAKDYIGYLGVGFKSVFLISKCPEIYSGGFKFKFDKKCWDDPEQTPWQIIPIWIDNLPLEFYEREGTLFILPIKEDTLMNKIREETKPEHLSNRILLFLRNIEAIEILDMPQNLKRKIVKSEVSRTADYEIFQIQEYKNESLQNSDYWVIFRSSCVPTKEVKEDYITKEWERADIDKREVLVAFRLGDEENIIVESKGTAHIGVFSFFPLKEIPSGLNFLIQADFLTTPGRGELARECLWNNWLAGEIYDLVVNKCIPTFLKHPKWKFNITEILYSLEGGHELFEYYIKKPLRDYLENNAVLIAEDDSVAKAEELVLLNKEIRQLLIKEDLQLLFPSRKIIHDDCRPHKALKIEEPPSNIFSFLEWSKSDELIKHKADLKDINWFKKLYSILVDKYDRWSYFQKHYYRYNVEYDFFWSKIHDFHKAVIPTNEFKLAKINECYINPREIDIPEQIKDKFKIVHSELEEDEKFNEFRKRVNIAELTEEDIKNVFKKQEILQLSEESWQNLPDNIKVEKIKHLKDLWASGYLALQDFSFLTLKSKNNFWLKPESLFFSKEYQPEHNLEIISLEKKLYDMPLEFISTEFIQNVDEDAIKQWYKFFKELGVDNQLEDKNFSKSLVQRIGILLALKYEVSKGRRAQELSQSEETGGYDIKQAEEEPEEVYGIIRSEERYIEVKSRRGPNPDIFLTTKQISTLRNKQDKYFVYVIKDALRYPTLCVTRGDKLLSITDIKIIIPFNKWSSEAQEDEFQP